MFDLELAQRFAAAIGIGLLFGIDRERNAERERRFGGIRTFALIALLGAVGAFVQQQLEIGWLAPLSFACIAAFVLVSYAITAPRGEVGITSEVSALLVFTLGLLCGFGHLAVAGASAVAALLLLVPKEQLRGLAERVAPADIEATLKFAVISLIILPLLPREPLGPPPFDVVSAYRVWWMVVLIAGLNFVGYLLVKWLGDEHGLGITGLLGGLVSSTATTLSFSQRSRAEPQQSSGFALAIAIAWTVMFMRVLVMVAIVNLAVAKPLAPTLVAMGLLCGLSAWLLSRRRVRSTPTGTVPSASNPFELLPAIQFGLLFGAVTIGARAAEQYFGDAGLYLAGALAGLTDVDAVTLSMANLALAAPARTDVAALAILLAVVSNTLVKAGMAATLGTPALRRSILLVTAGLIVAAALAAGVTSALR